MFKSRRGIFLIRRVSTVGATPYGQQPTKVFLIEVDYNVILIYASNQSGNEVLNYKNGKVEFKRRDEFRKETRKSGSFPGYR